MSTALLINLLTSPFVYFCMQLSGLTLFRQKIKGNARNIILTALLVSLVNISLHYSQLGYLVAAIQSITFILCNRYLFRFHWKFAVIISSIIYSLGGLAEFIVYSFNSLLTRISAIERFTNNNFALAIYVALFLMIVICLLQSFRIGFTFINAANQSNMMGYLTNVLLGLSIINIIMNIAVTWSMFMAFPLQYVYFAILIVIFLFIILIQLYYQKEMKEA